MEACRPCRYISFVGVGMAWIHEFAGWFWGMTWYKTFVYNRRCVQCGEGAGEVGYASYMKGAPVIFTLCSSCWLEKALWKVA